MAHTIKYNELEGVYTVLLASSTEDNKKLELVFLVDESGYPMTGYRVTRGEEKVDFWVGSQHHHAQAIRFEQAIMFYNILSLVTEGVEEE